jgi:uncharacterized protein YcbK (DUF882 family)
MTRRELMGAMLFGATSLLVAPDWALAAKSIRGSRLKDAKKHLDPTPQLVRPSSKIDDLHSGLISLYNPHTREFLKIRYMNKNGMIDKMACDKLNYFFRCHATGKKIGIDPEVFLLLDAVRTRVGAKDRPYILYSGYRSPAYNRMLRRLDKHVAQNSYHTKGMAADIAIDDVRLSDIERTARDLCIGGVGKYDDFVHLDVGPVRYW